MESSQNTSAQKDNNEIIKKQYKALKQAERAKEQERLKAAGLKSSVPESEKAFPPLNEMYQHVIQSRQNFAEKNELKYRFYRLSCGRDRRLDKLWGNNARSTNLWSE